MRGEAAVEAHNALLQPYESEALDQARILGQAVGQGCLSKAGSDDLDRVDMLGNVESADGAAASADETADA